MNADIAGALAQIDKSWKGFEHKGKRLTKEQVIKVLEFGLSKGYKTTDQFTDEEVDNLLKPKTLNAHGVDEELGIIDKVLSENKHDTNSPSWQDQNDN